LYCRFRARAKKGGFDEKNRPVIVLLLLVTVPAFAENPRNYAALKLGAYLPQADDMDNFNDGSTLK